MVGVLRSKACNACRARRKKCDEQQPACGPCIKRGAKCVYRNDINFVFFQPTLAKAPNGSDSDTASNTDPDAHSDTNSTSMTRQTTPYSFGSQHSSPFDLPISVLLQAQSYQAHGFFLDNYLPKTPKSFDLHSSTDSFSSTAWYKTAGDLAPADPLLDDALLALSLKYAEQNLGSTDAAYQGQLIYGRVVKNLSHRLGNQSEALRDTTLAAVMALTTWETQAAGKDGATGWLSHVRGALMLVQLRGSMNFATDFGKKLYLGSLLSNLIAAIGDRKAISHIMPFATDFADPDYASYAKLFQVLYTLPAILEQCDKVNFDANRKAPRSLVVTKSSTMSYMVREFESRLLDWTAQLAETPEDPLFWKEPTNLGTHLPPDSPSRVFKHFNCFRSLDIAQQLVFSWSCHLLANLALATNVKALKENGYLDISTYATDSDSANIFVKLYKLSVDILQSFEYFLHPDMGLTAVDFLGLPVNLVYGFMKPRGFPEALWFDLLFDRMREVSPGFAAFLQAMAEQGGGGRAFKLLVQKDSAIDLCCLKLPEVFLALQSFTYVWKNYKARAYFRIEGDVCCHSYTRTSLVHKDHAHYLAEAEATYAERMSVLTTKITPCLWFDGQANDAAKHYVNLFNTSPHASKHSTSSILRTTNYLADVHQHCTDFAPGTVLNVSFSLAGQPFLALNGGPVFNFTPAVSLMVECEDQDEIDHFWAGFGEEKKERELNCGWINDRWGLSWQVVPKYLRELVESEDRTKYNRVHVWMHEPKNMPKKFMIEDLLKAAEDGDSAATNS